MHQHASLADRWAGGAFCQEGDTYLGLALLARQTTARRSACVYHIANDGKFGLGVCSRWIHATVVGFRKISS